MKLSARRTPYGRCSQIQRPGLSSNHALAIGKIRAMGITVLLVEQNVELALEICESVAVLDHGRIIFRGNSSELMGNTKLKEVYLGLA